MPSSTLKKRVLCKNVKDVVESRASPTISMKTHLLGPIDSSSPGRNNGCLLTDDLLIPLVNLVVVAFDEKLVK